MGFMKKENTGVDTETLNGYVKLICSDDGSFKEVESFIDCVKFLTHVRFRNKNNWLGRIFQSIYL